MCRAVAKRTAIVCAWCLEAAVEFQGWDLLRWASGSWEKPQPYLLVPRRNGAFPLREDRARDCVRGRAKPRRCVQTGTLRVRPTSTHEPRASTVERVPWAQSPGINGRGVDLHDFTRADQHRATASTRSTHDAVNSATSSAPTANSQVKQELVVEAPQTEAGETGAPVTSREGPRAQVRQTRTADQICTTTRLEMTSAARNLVAIKNSILAKLCYAGPPETDARRIATSLKGKEG
ncbi:hypothetical protein HPB52_006488 [Rhipicephalus sanguineus]|uniref:Uncharacterized protein n=1 Tax=Rhipicephalus sanguineus TaxID=34632 RepID=A0A9D4QI96_RHISA|nr:hypothetical protein HPB52_006488 [Rhipicephalus sanguineus]